MDKLDQEEQVAFENVELKDQSSDQLNETEDEIQEEQDNDNNNNDETTEKSFWNVLKRHSKSELREIFTLSWPIIISNVMTTLLGLVDMAFVGHLGKDYLAAAALGNAFFMCLGFAPSTMVSAQDVLVSQAFGMKNNRAKKAVLYRSFFIVLLACLPVLALFMFSDKILFYVFRQDKVVSDLTGRFVRLNAIGLYPFSITIILSRYLNAQSCVISPMITTVLANVINAVLNTLLVRGVGYQGFGFNGAPIATSITRVCCMFMLIALTIRFEQQKQQEDINESESDSGESEVNEIKESRLETIKKTFIESIRLRGIVEYLKLGIPGLFQTMLEVWGFELTTISAGLLPGTVYIAAHSVSMNIIVITFMIPMSISIATSIRIGQCLGAGEATRSKVVSFLSVVVGVVFMLFNAGQLMAFRKLYGKLFTGDKEVIALVSSIIPICALFQVIDGAQVTLNGILYGTGKLVVSAAAKFISFYVLGLPLGSLLAFYFDLKLHGLWIGLAMGLFAVCILVVFYVVLRIDFEVEVRKAQERVARSDIKDEPSMEEITPTTPAEELSEQN